MTRYFLMTGAPTPGDLLDRAGEHGTPGRAVAHRTPAGSGVYGVVEIRLASAGIGSGGAVEISKDSGPVAALAPAPLGIHRVADAFEETGGDEGASVKEATRPGVVLAPDAPRGAP